MHHALCGIHGRWGRVRADEGRCSAHIDVIIMVAKSQVGEGEEAEDVARDGNVVLCKDHVQDGKSDAERVVQFNLDRQAAKSSAAGLSEDLDLIDVDLGDVQSNIHVVN